MDERPRWPPDLDSRRFTRRVETLGSRRDPQDRPGYDWDDASSSTMSCACAAVARSPAAAYLAAGLGRARPEEVWASQLGVASEDASGRPASPPWTSPPSGSPTSARRRSCGTAPTRRSQRHRLAGPSHGQLLRPASVASSPWLAADGPGPRRVLLRRASWSGCSITSRARERAAARWRSARSTRGSCGSSRAGGSRHRRRRTRPARCSTTSDTPMVRRPARLLGVAVVLLA